jgi:DNA-binding IclR family transcriptional regulator
MAGRSDKRGHHGTQSVHRVALLLRTIASAENKACRLIDLATLTKLQRPTVHRLLKGLMNEGLVDQEPSTRRYRLGQLVFELGLAAVPQFNLRQLCEPALLRIAEQTGDTVFLSARSGYDAVCLDRKEGSFPIKTLTVDVGNRRPLGVGAGGGALLMALRQEEVDEILAANAKHFSRYANLTVKDVRMMVKRAHEIGYMFNDRQVTPGAMSIGLPITDPYGPPVGAISIGAITDRMDAQRRQALVAVLRREVKELERQIQMHSRHRKNRSQADRSPAIVDGDKRVG